MEGRIVKEVAPERTREFAAGGVKVQHAHTPPLDIEEIPMNSRLLLSLFIAVMPISVQMGAPPDTTPQRAGEAPLGAQTRLRAAGSIGEFSIINRGCNGEILGEVKSQLKSGALEVQHRFASGLVIGARGGQVVESAAGSDGAPFASPALLAGRRTNAYANPYIGFDGPEAGVGVGWLKADHSFVVNENETSHPDVTAHVRFGGRRQHLTVRYMEGMPLESEGALTVEFGGSASPRSDVSVFAGLHGPFDGALIGVKGDVWLTPEAALSVRLGLGGYGQYSAGAGAVVRFGGR